MPGDLVNRYAYLKKHGELVAVEEPLSPTLPSSDYVRLKLAYCGLCGSDLAFLKGRKAAVYPRTLGHEQVGQVIDVGSEVSGISVGNWIAVDPNTRCGTCHYCRTGASNHCERSAETWFHPRGLAKYQDIHSSYLHVLPELNPVFIGALSEPLSCALHAIDRAKVRPDDNALILGCGSMGSMVIFGLLSKFDSMTMAIHDSIAGRMEGLTQAFPGRIRPYEMGNKNDDYSVVFEATGNSDMFQIATQCASPEGRIVVISRYRNVDTINLQTSLCHKELDIRFSHLNGDGKTMGEAIQLLKTKWQTEYNRLIEIIDINNLEDAFKRMQTSHYNKTIIRLNDNYR